MSNFFIDLQSVEDLNLNFLHKTTDGWEESNR